MGWGLLLYVLLGFAPLWQSAPGLATVVLVGWFFLWLRRLNTAGGNAESKPAPRPAGKRLLSESGLHDLLVLRLELNRLLAAGHLPPERHAKLTGKIDQLWAFHLSRFGVNAEDALWRERREVGWEVLGEFSGLPLGLPPWHLPPPVAEAAPSAPADFSVPPPPVFRPAPEPEPAQAAATPPPRIERVDRPTPRPAYVPPPPRPKPLPPQEPGTLEKALQAMSGWSVWLVPFLVQNIGWFVGGFCFVAGSVFLVAYTGGYAKAFTVFAVLVAYSVLLLWGAYQLRRQRPELLLSSMALLTLALALVPLTMAAAVRLWLAADSALLYGVALLAALMYGTGSYWVVALASGMMDRSLQGRHPQLFLALSLSQWAVLALSVWPYWPLLALVHLGLLAVLGYALLRFTPDWLRSVFIDRRKIAYYAAGSLVYAALVAFVHLTWGAGPIALPDGYAGPFLMALAGLLFQVDAEFKQWGGRNAYLSRFSFALYGLSGLALALAAGSFGAAVLTLLLGLGVYTVVVWRYLTWPPLALWLGCAFWLYGLLVLRSFDAPWHLLLSLPGLLALRQVSGYLARRSETLAYLIGGVLAWTVALLLAWVLAHSEPGWLAFASVLAVLGLARAFAVGWDAAPRSYLTAFLSALALAYAPPLWSAGWAMQTTLGLWLLACAWTGLAQAAVRRDQYCAEAWLNAALLGLALALLLALAAWPSASLTSPSLYIALCVALGAVLLWQSVAFYLRGAVYAVLLAFGLAGALVKLAYFPAPSNGGMSFLLALALCAGAGGLERATAAQAAARREWGLARPALTLFGVLPSGSERVFSLGELLGAPLWQAAALLWLLGLGAGLSEWGLGRNDLAWALAVVLGALAFVPLAGQFRIALWPPVPMLMVWAALAAWPVAGDGPFCLAGIVYAGLAWRGSIALFAAPSCRRVVAWAGWDLGLGDAGSRLRLEQSTHYTGLGISLFSLAVLLHAPWHIETGIMAAALLAALLFFHQAGWRYRSLPHSYLVLGLAVVGLGLAYAEALPSADWDLSHVGGGGALGLAVVALAFYGLARGLGSRWDQPDDSFADSLYRKPLHEIGLLLAWVGMVLALLRVAAWGWTPDMAAVAALGLSVVAVLLLNRRLAFAGLDLLAVWLAVLDLLWLVLIVRHDAAPFDPWHDPAGDIWITLALLAWGVAALGRSLRGRDDAGTLDTAFYGLALLLGLRLSLPLTVEAAPVLLGASTAPLELRWGEMALAALLGLALPTATAYRRSALLIHGRIAASSALVLWLYLGMGAAWFHPPLLFVLGCAAFLGLARMGAPQALRLWATTSLLAALALLPRFFFGGLKEGLLTLLLAAGLCLALARAWQSRLWVYAGLLSAALWLHGWPWLWLDPLTTDAPRLPTFYSLQWALLLWLWPRLCGDGRLADGWRGEVQHCALNARPWLLALLLVEWALHGWLFAQTLAAGAMVFGPTSHAAALAAGGWLLVLELRRLDGDYDSDAMYPLLALGLALLGYLRLLAWGLAAPGLGDSVAVVALTFALAWLHRLTASTPILRLANMLPVLILLTARWELASASASFNLLAVGGLYLWLGRSQASRWPAWLGLLCCNAAVYVWVPQWARQAELLQIYVVPAAGSVLLMLHLHRHELRPDTLNACRLSATSLLYASATLDVFRRPGFGVFLLALGLSLASIMVGISLRVRAFVYSGLSFLV
ncbi:MAG: hypothetical protein ACKN9T_18460, partial [Candidatus Methylumidiphilus sp.]